MWHPWLLGLCQSFPISEKMLIQRCFSFLFMLSIKTEHYPLMFDITAFQFRLNALHEPCRGPKYCLSPNGQTGTRKSRICPNDCLKGVNIKARKSPEDLIFQPPPYPASLCWLFLQSFIYLGQVKEDNKWQSSIVTCWDSFEKCSVWFQFYVNLLCIFIYKVDLLLSKVWTRWTWLLLWLSKGLSFIYCLKI